MNDLISRQMLLEYIHGEPVGRLLCDKYNLDGLIKQFPSAQPYTDEEIQKMQDIEQAQLDKAYELGYQEGRAAQPKRKRGKWKIIMARHKYNGEYREMRQCSECHAAYFHYANQEDIEDEIPNFCPNCGADMREVSE